MNCPSKENYFKRTLKPIKKTQKEYGWSKNSC